MILPTTQTRTESDKLKETFKITEKTLISAVRCTTDEVEYFFRFPALLVNQSPTKSIAEASGYILATSSGYGWYQKHNPVC